jgi:4-coumarate--CoA ligase
MISILAELSSSPSNAIGYMGDPESTRRTFDQDGYLHTGDVGYFDQEGNLFIVDRIKELIKSKGMQVAPAELEAHLLELPFVLDAGVIGVPDEYAGEVPRAYVVLDQQTHDRIKMNVQEEENVKELVRKHVRDQKVKYKWLTGGVVFVETIPKNQSGKILRKELRERAKREIRNEKSKL